MEVEGGGGGGREVVELEDAVKLLVEHLVKPVLPHGTLRREEALKPENQDAVARQVRMVFGTTYCTSLCFVGSDAVALGFRGRGGVGEQSMELAVFSTVRVRFVLGTDLGSFGVPHAWGTRKSRLLHNDPLLRFVDVYIFFFSRLASTYLTRQTWCLPFLPVRLV
jgi:hypothetical protein